MDYDSYGPSKNRNSQGVINSVNSLLIHPTGDVANQVAKIANFQQGYSQFIPQNHFGYLNGPAPRDYVVEKQIQAGEYQVLKYTPIQKTGIIQPY